MKISCKMCGANLKYVPSSQKACCEHCGNLFEPNEIEYNDSVYDECEQYTCSSCGAELMTFEKTGIVKCMYCGGNEFVKGKVNKEYLLQGIFPFKVDREQFVKSYEEYLKISLDIEKKFGKKLQETITSIYLPYTFANNFFRKQYLKEVNELLEEVIPYDFKELKDMNPIYLDNCLAEIIKTKKEENDIKTNDPDFYLVPIWIAKIEFKYVTYYIVMNGQTGEMAGSCNSRKIDEKYEKEIISESNLNYTSEKKRALILQSICISLVIFLITIIPLVIDFNIQMLINSFLISVILGVVCYKCVHKTMYGGNKIKIENKSVYTNSAEIAKFHISALENKMKNSE